MSAIKITTMAQLRNALQQGGYVTRYSYRAGDSATYRPEGFKDYYPPEGQKNTAWPVGVSLVAFNALQNRGELRRLDTQNYKSSDWVLKSTGYTVVEAEAKVTAAKQKLEAADGLLAEAAQAQAKAYDVWEAAEAELAKLVPNA